LNLVGFWYFLGCSFKRASCGEESLAFLFLRVVPVSFSLARRAMENCLVGCWAGMFGCIGSLYVALSKLVGVFVDIESNRHVLYCLDLDSIVVDC
jgi:hypothetical protein